MTFQHGKITSQNCQVSFENVVIENTKDLESFSELYRYVCEVTKCCRKHNLTDAQINAFLDSSDLKLALLQGELFTGDEVIHLAKLLPQQKPGLKRKTR